MIVGRNVMENWVGGVELGGGPQRMRLIINGRPVRIHFVFGWHANERRGKAVKRAC